MDQEGITDRTLPHFMATNGVADIMVPLIRTGFSLEAQDSDYRTPLHLAVTGNYDAAVSVLVEEADANVHAKDMNSLLPFHYALAIDVDNISENVAKVKSKAAILRLLARKTELNMVKNTKAKSVLKRMQKMPNTSLTFEEPGVRVGKGI